MQLTPLQSMGSGFSAACLGPVCTGPFDVIKASLHSLWNCLLAVLVVLILGLDRESRSAYHITHTLPMWDSFACPEL